MWGGGSRLHPDALTSAFGQKQPFTCVVDRTFTRRLLSVTSHPIVKVQRSFIDDCRRSVIGAIVSMTGCLREFEKQYSARFESV